WRPTRMWIEYRGGSVIHFADHSYRRIDLIRFAWDGSGDDREVLAAVIASGAYRDSFLSEGPDYAEEWDPAEAVHGPVHARSHQARLFRTNRTGASCRRGSGVLRAGRSSTDGGGAGSDHGRPDAGDPSGGLLSTAAAPARRA